MVFLKPEKNLEIIWLYGRRLNENDEVLEGKVGVKQNHLVKNSSELLDLWNFLRKAHDDGFVHPVVARWEGSSRNRSGGGLSCKILR